jgi:RND family efflux transporter MFP subunit
MKRSIVWIILIALLALTVWKLASNKSVQKERVYRHDRNAAVHVTVDSVRQRAFTDGVRYSGTISSLREGKVMAEVPGRVVALEVSEGQWVEKGQVMMRLDGDLLRLQLEAAQVQLEGLEKDQQRYTVLTGADAVQGIQLEKTELALRGARIQVNTLKEQVQRTAITAPFSGHVTQLGVEVGTVLNPSMPVAMITDDRALELVVAVPGTELAAFTKGQAVRVSLEGEARQVQGTVESIGSRGDMAHNFPVRITLQADPDHRVKPGMAATVLSIPDSKSASLTIPSSAIIGSSLDPEVYVVENGIAKRKRIGTGDRDAGMVAVTEGLATGDVVITSGFISLADGAPVKFR